MAYYFSGTIERVIFENASNYFKILLLDIEETDADFSDFEIIVTGTIADVIEGENYTFWGDLIQHPKYGEQLKASRYEKARPTASGLVKYFSSEQFKGIGKKTAERIVELYGEQPIDAILEDPSHLSTISGLSKANRDNFLAKLRLNYGAEQILSKLAELGLSNKLALQVFETYKEQTLDIINNEPYRLVEDIKGIGFAIADQLAEQLGIASDAPQRFRAGLVHSLTELSIERGDTYVEARDLLEASLTLLEKARPIELDPSLVANELSQLLVEEKVANEGTKIFEKTLDHSEKGIHKHIKRLLEQNNQHPFKKEAISQVIQKVEKNLGIQYDSTQKEAIHQAVTSPFFILTGGPGTGKTTVINGIISVYADLHGIDLHKNDLPIILVG